MPGPGLNAYKKTITETSSGRNLEAHVLTKAAQGLRDCQAHWGEEGHDERLGDALRRNQNLWTFFQAELVSESNPLPQELKDDILRLSIFIDNRTFEVMAAPTPEKLDALITININLAAGLNGSVGGPESVVKPAGESEETRGDARGSAHTYSRSSVK